MTNGQIYIGSMSHETAIGILKLMLEAMEVYDSISPTLERVNAVKMGIEALEQESNCLKIPTGSTTKDYLGVDYLGVDAVSRQALIDWLTNWTLGDATPLIDFVNSMPSVTPQLSSGLEKNSKKLEKDFGESDCISRSDVLKLMQDNWHTHNGDWAMQESMDDIRALPAVTPQEPRWIPVSEKLPNDRDWYLGIFKESDTGWINPLPFICDYVGRETKATTKEFWILHGFTDMDEHIDYYYNLECVAWMPLPQNYGEVAE